MFSYLSSGLFLGWSLGANDVPNIFGPAVSSRMISFRLAATIASIFIILGAVSSGSGTSQTLGKLGAVNAIAGSFTVAFAAAFTVFLMIKMKMNPVSVTQAIVGAIIGWNLFTHSTTDYSSLLKIIISWILGPAIAGLFAAGLFLFYRWSVKRIRVHLFTMDSITRWGMIIVGAFGSFALGANNIGNVMGVFVPVAPFSDLEIAGLFTISTTQILFLIGGIAIASGIITYSRKVMERTGSALVKLSPETALLAVVAHSLVLFIFASKDLETFLLSMNLPTIPLVPISSSQAIVGAIIGIGIAKGGSGIRFNILGRIASGWITTPIIAGIISFISLFIVQNVFDQQVYAQQTIPIQEQTTSIEPA